MCSWNDRNENNFYDINKNKILNYYFSVINNLKIIYILGFGSELGSYRNHGLIKRDHDIDIIIPIWMNYHIFKCKNYIYYKPNKCKIFTNPNFTICNKTRLDFLIILKDYIEKRINKRINFICNKWGKYGYTSCWMFKTKNIFLDMWIILGNEYVYSDIKLCKCMFSENIAYCDKNAFHNIIKLYGKNYTTPVENGSGEIACKTIINPNTNNSIIKMI